MNESTKKELMRLQAEKATEQAIYAQLSSITKSVKTRNVLKDMAAREEAHVGMLRELTGELVTENAGKVARYVFLAKRLGYNFALRKLQKGEAKRVKHYRKLQDHNPDGFASIIVDEEKNKKDMVELIDKKELEYVGSIVLGMNDALVEHSGSLAGLTLAFQDTRLIASDGLYYWYRCFTFHGVF